MKLSSAVQLLVLQGLPFASGQILLASPPPMNSGDYCCANVLERRNRFLEAMEPAVKQQQQQLSTDERNLQIGFCNPCKQSCPQYGCFPMSAGCQCHPDMPEELQGPWCDDIHVCEDDPSTCCSQYELPEDYFIGCAENMYNQVFCEEDEIENNSPATDCDNDYCCIHGYFQYAARARQRFLQLMDPVNKNNYQRKLQSELTVIEGEDDDCNPCEEDCFHSYCFPMEQICSCDGLPINGGEEYDVKMVSQMEGQLTTVEMMDGQSNYVVYECPDNLGVCQDDRANCCIEGVPAFSEDLSCGEIPYTTFCPAGGANGSCGGDPHFKTWGGDWFDFHGICDLILVRAKAFAKGLGLDIHIRTKERYGYSFIESAIVRIGDSILEVSGYGQYSLNGISGAVMPNVMAELFALTYIEKNDKEHIFSIQIGKKEKIEVSTFKDMVSVKVDYASKKNFGDSEGLMGTFPKGKMMDRNGNAMPTVDNFNAFGQEWQVLDSEDMLFQTIRAPQHPQKCFIPEPKKESRRRLGETISMEAAKEACAHWDEDKKDMCIFDVLAMADLEVAQAHGAY